MENSLVPIDPALLALLHSSFRQDGSLMPFAREIMLIEATIAGTSYRDLTSIEPELQPEALLVLQREPSNPHDPLAIQIRNEVGKLLGYIPRIKNEALAHLMDAGKLIFARLVSKVWQGEWLKVEVRVFLRD